MLINWFTVLAQIVNFLILVVLLKFFLYDRIIKAMDEREAKIRARLNEAKAKAKEAEQEADAFRSRNKELENKREAMLAQAKEEAEAHRKALTEQARHDVTNLIGRKVLLKLWVKVDKDWTKNPRFLKDLGF